MIFSWFTFSLRLISLKFKSVFQHEICTNLGGWTSVVILFVCLRHSLSVRAHEKLQKIIKTLQKHHEELQTSYKTTQTTTEALRQTTKKNYSLEV